MNHAICIALLATLLLSACGGKPELPPAKPLSAPESQLAQIPGINRGPMAVVLRDAVDWNVGDRTLRARAIHPEGDGPFPLIVFSHGFASSDDQYDALATHWASHGYAVVLPYHPDGGGMPRGIWNSLRYGNLGLVAARVRDVEFVLDNIDRLDALSPGLAARIDRQRLVAAGHSFGAFTAQQFGGAIATDPDNGEQAVAKRYPGIRAIVAISPPAEMFEVINRESWRLMDAPMLVTTGTWDADGRFVTDWRQKRMSFETARPGQNWLLVVEGADHYLGNLICRLDRDVAAQPDALRMVNATSTGFLNAFVKGDDLARAFLDERPLQALSNGFAELSFR